MDDRFAYYVTQTPRDSSRCNSFFHRSSPTSSTNFINSIQGVSTRLRNLGKGGDSDDAPLQQRVSSIEDTIDSVHTTVANLETAMSDIVKLLQTKPTPNPSPVQSTPTKVTTFPERKATVTNHPTTTTNPNSYSYADSTRHVIPPVSPTVTPASVTQHYGNRGLRPNGSANVPTDFDSELKSPMGQRQRRRQEYISGHYWHSCQFDIHDGKEYSRFQVAWLHHKIDGPYKGKPDKLQKLSLTLADDSTKVFLRFYTALRSGLGTCSYHEELLPTLSAARVGFDVRDTPLVDEDLVTVGKTMEMDEPPRDHWQSQHDSTLGMNLYPLMEYAIKESATRSRPLVDNSITLGNPNGLNILHDLMRYHHPRVLDSLAPPFDHIHLNSPKMRKPSKGSTCDLTVDDFKARCNEWELSISMHPEVQNIRRSQHALKQLQGILPILKSHVLLIENHMTRHYQQHRFETREPPLMTHTPWKRR
jgi:hypothetical protein